jgi:hypothetical protein
MAEAVRLAAPVKFPDTHGFTVYIHAWNLIDLALDRQARRLFDRILEHGDCAFDGVDTVSAAIHAVFAAFAPPVTS